MAPARPDPPELAPGSGLAANAPPKAAKASTRGETWRETGRLLDRHMSIGEVAEARGLKTATVLNHMENLAREGKRFPPEAFMDPERLAFLRDLFKTCGSWQLGPVVLLSREDSNPDLPGRGETDFEEARLARILLYGRLPPLNSTLLPATVP
ncbi:MAG: helix-turn-helix domain-containing protein [Deltaproteobacteria bacterium]|nr:helix-turn-helix domain-containing protein [Deltaproteobacteria bacterium]